MPPSTGEKRRTSPPPGSKTADPPARDPPLSKLALLFYAFAGLSTAYYLAGKTSLAPYLPFAEDGLSGVWEAVADLGSSGFSGVAEGHADFGDGRKTGAPRSFLKPKSEGLHYVNVMLGNGGPEPDLSGGMIPAVGPPFAMTRWTPQTRFNYVSMCPYNQTDTTIHGFLGTHQPAVWMGESGPVQIAPGLGPVVTDFQKRGMRFSREDEYASPNYYSNVLQSNRGPIGAELTATSRVSHMRFTFHSRGDWDPYFVVDASRVSAITSNPKNVSYPHGNVTVDFQRNEIYGWNDERQDHILVGEELPAKNFKGYFVARFSEPFQSGGISREGKIESVKRAEGKVLSGWVTFARHTLSIEVRVGVSFISVEQARRNIDLEVPDGQSLPATSVGTRAAWAAKLDLLTVNGASEDNRTVLYTGLHHTLVYPYEVHENAGTHANHKWQYYSGYTDKVEQGQSYSGYSIWDTFRATTAWQLIIAPERIPGMLNSMLQDYVQGGWLPMWKNIVETNIMVGTHADSIFAQAISAGMGGFDLDLAWKAVKKNAYVPPDRDTELTFFDREEHTPQEVRAGLTEYLKNGWVADDLHSESGSRTLDYAYDDHAAAIVARAAGATKEAEELLRRSKNYERLWNKGTGFMEARNADGSWAGDQAGWTEGDHWAYSLNVMHDVPGLTKLMGGADKLIDFLDRHFAGGHNLHTNEPSHHIPYIYALAGAASKAQAAVRKLGREEYNHTDTGLSGNEDCGQMSAWYIFSALGFYPVDPASATYVLAAPFFDRLELKLPATYKDGTTESVVITAAGASEGKQYVRGVKINGNKHNSVTISHSDLAHGGEIDFDMASTPQSWPN